MAPPSANDLTARIMFAIQVLYGDSIMCWRNNTGAGIGWSLIQAAVKCLMRRDIPAALKLLSRPVYWGLVGSADILCVMRPGGRLCGIEVKAVGDRQRPEQEAFQIRIESVGGVYILATDVDKAVAEFGLRRDERLRCPHCGEDVTGKK